MISRNLDEIIRRWSELTGEDPHERVRLILENLVLHSDPLFGSIKAMALDPSPLDHRILRNAIFDVLESDPDFGVREFRFLMHALEQENDYRDRFVLVMAHDLRSPLTAIRASSELILRQPDKTDRNISLARRIVNTSDRLDRMISNLLDASSIQAGKAVTLEVEHVQLAPLLSEILDDLVLVHGSRFTLEVDPSLSGYWSPDGLARVVENLATNAVKYGDPHRPITIRAVAALQSPDLPIVEIQVHNWGNPIRPEHQSSLFQLFRRTPEAENGTQKGWGIGLVLVRGIAQSHGGSIQVQSSAERGTTFTLTLPQDAQPPESL